MKLVLVDGVLLTLGQFRIVLATIGAQLVTPRRPLIDVLSIALRPFKAAPPSTLHSHTSTATMFINKGLKVRACMTVIST